MTAPILTRLTCAECGDVVSRHTHAEREAPTSADVALDEARRDRNELRDALTWERVAFEERRKRLDHAEETLASYATRLEATETERDTARHALANAEQLGKALADQLAEALDQRDALAARCAQLTTLLEDVLARGHDDREPDWGNINAALASPSTAASEYVERVRETERGPLLALLRGWKREIDGKNSHGESMTLFRLTEMELAQYPTKAGATVAGEEET